MESQGRRNAVIIAALITGSAGVVAAALSNWDKLVGATPATPVPQPVQPPKQDSAVPAPAPESQAVEESAAPVASVSMPNIAGLWNTPNGGMQVFQSGAEFGLEEYAPGGILLTRGGGRIEGRRMIYSYERGDGGGGTIRGNCIADVAPGDRAMTGACTVGQMVYPARAWR